MSTDLPKTITRPCCSGKSCETTLTLVKYESDAPIGNYPDLYTYERGNGNNYTGTWMSEAALRTWIEATKG